MRRPTLNLVVDSVAFAGFVFLTTTGVLMRYVLPPGSGHRTLVWGLGRHDWGAIHFWIATVFLGVLALPGETSHGIGGRIGHMEADPFLAARL